MALSVDLFGLDEDGTVLWRWMCRSWNGGHVLDLVAPPPSDAPLSWAGPITRAQIETLRDRAGGRDAERLFRASQTTFGATPDADLDELLARPASALAVRVEEWGYG